MVMGYVIDFLPYGILFLLIYIIIDCVRHKIANLLYRVLFFSFLFYLLFVFQYTTGGFHYPPQERFFGTLIFQLVPLQFVLDLLYLYQHRGLDWFFWNSVRLSFFNVIMLLPLGIYLAVLFNKKDIKKATIIILSVSFTIEIYQLIFSYFGLVFPRTFNVDDIILNTLGGIAGYFVSKLVLQRWFPQGNVKKEPPMK